MAAIPDQWCSSCQTNAITVVTCNKIICTRCSMPMDVHEGAADVLYALMEYKGDGPRCWAISQFSVNSGVRTLDSWRPADRKRHDERSSP